MKEKSVKVSKGFGERMSKSIKQKPTLHLVQGNKLNDPKVLADLYTKLTGKPATPEEMAEAMAALDGSDLQSSAVSPPHD